MSLTPRAFAALRAVAATLVGGGAEDGGDLATRVAGHVAMLPRAADRAELDLLLKLLESRVVNLLIAGIPRPLSAMAHRVADFVARCPRFPPAAFISVRAVAVAGNTPLASGDGRTGGCA